MRHLLVNEQKWQNKTFISGRSEYNSRKVILFMGILVNLLQFYLI